MTNYVSYFSTYVKYMPKSKLKFYDLDLMISHSLAETECYNFLNNCGYKCVDSSVSKIFTNKDKNVSKILTTLFDYETNEKLAIICTIIEK